MCNSSLKVRTFVDNLYREASLYRLTEHEGWLRGVLRIFTVSGWV